MTFINNIAIFFFAAGLIVLSGCGINVELSSPGTEPVAPPVESEDSAPVSEPSAEENLLAQLTPTGVLVMAGDGLLTLVDPQGTEVTTIPVPDLVGGDPRNLHLAGSWMLGEPVPLVVYHAFQPEQAIRSSSGGSIKTLRATETFMGIGGAPGQPALAYSILSYEGDFPTSRLFASTPDSIADAPAFYETKDSQLGMVLLPVAVEAVGGQPQGVWYIHTAWGIGGVDLIYPINRGLYFYDLTTGQNSVALNIDRNYQGISPDRSLAASVPFGGGGDASMSIQDLGNGNLIDFPLNPATDRGAGYAVFSPNSKYIAWMEAGGSLTGDPEFMPIIRVGDTSSGSILTEMDKNAVAQAAGWERVSWMKPVGFLDDQTVLVEARGEDWGTVAVLEFDLSANTIELFHQGSFSGFAYP